MTDSASKISGRIKLSLAVFEIIAAALFLHPRTLKLGAVLLWLVFLWAIGFHILHGEYGFGALIVYGAAVWVIWVYKQERTGGGND